MQRTKVGLDRRAIVELGFCFAEAERSVHRVLDPAAAWPDFQQYYSAAKRESLSLHIQRLSEMTVCAGADSCSARRSELLAILRPPGLLGVLLARLSGPWKSKWSFSLPEVCFMATTWQSFLKSLDLDEKPAADDLIALRKDLSLCGWILRFRCCGMREMEQLKSVAHFRQTEWLKTLQLADLVDDAA